MMKKLVCAVSAAAVMVLFGAAGALAGGIAGSAHDLTSKAGSSTDETCVFCHTPHNNAGSSAGAPMWNRNAPAGPFTAYDSVTLDADASAGPQGVSLACLSCHDGITAFDALIVQGGITATGHMTGSAVIGTDLTNDHPISIQYGLPPADFTAAVSGKVGVLPLYGASTDQVECATCHNPHDTTNNPFLRVANSGSALCLTCHLK